MADSIEDRAARTARRTVLALAAVPLALAVPALAGCTADGVVRRAGGSGAVRPTPSVDDVARSRAVRTTQRLLADLLSARDVPAKVRDAVVTDHRAHLVALGAAGATATGGSPSPSLSPSPSASPATPRSLVRAEAAGAREALADVPGVSRDVATVLVRVAAARAAHADVVARATKVSVAGAVTTPAAPAGARPSARPSAQPSAQQTSTPSGAAGSATASAGAPQSGEDVLPALTPAPTVSRSTGDLDALGRLVEAEHAAVFGYAVVVPRVSRNRRDLAVDLWQAHRVNRDRAEDVLTSAGKQPPAALPAYAVDVPRSAAAATSLAADLEAGVARVAVWAAGRSTGEARAFAADLAVISTRRRAQWLGEVPPFTG